LDEPIIAKSWRIRWQTLGGKSNRYDLRRGRTIGRELAQAAHGEWQTNKNGADERR
jgi:hypothetical protein